MTRRRPLTPEQRLAVNQIRKIEAELNDTFKRLSLGITNDFRFLRQPLDSNDHLRIMRHVDDLLSPTFGVTRELVKDGELYRMITTTMEDTIIEVMEHNLGRVKGILDRRDPTLWQKLESKIVSGPLKNDKSWEYIVRMQNGDHVARERLLRSKSLDVNRRWLPKDKWTTKRGYRLSDRIWVEKRSVRTKINNIVKDGIAAGTDPLDVAKELERYLQHAAGSEVRMTADGREIRRNLTQAPRSGWGNVSARRLAVTELQRVNAAAALETARIMPGVVGMQYVLSNAHILIDHCDSNAQGHSEGLPTGVYTLSEFPLIPDHPWCRCTAITEFDETDDWIDEMVNDVLSEAEVA